MKGKRRLYLICPIPPCGGALSALSSAKASSDIMSEEKEGRKCDVEEKEEVGKEEITPGRFPFFLK